MMHFQQISELLDRYWEGETSLEEERQLRRYFTQGPIDERLREVAPLFRAIADAQQVQAPDFQTPVVEHSPLKVVSFNPIRRYLAAAAITGIIAIGAWWAIPDHTPTNGGLVATVTPPVSTPAAEVIQEKINAAPPVASAPQKRKKRQTPKAQTVSAQESYTDADALRAAEEIKAALALISKKMNRGKTDANKGLKKIQVVDQYIKTPSEG